MAAEFEAKVAIPTDLIAEFVELLTNKKSFDKWKAIQLGLKVAQWLVETFGGSPIALTAKLPPGTRMSNKKVADALTALSSGDSVAKAAIPIWLLPIIIKLVIKWLAK